LYETQSETTVLVQAKYGDSTVTTSVGLVGSQVAHVFPS